MLSVEQLREHFRVTEGGAVFWRRGQRAGMRAGWDKGDGYRVASLNGTIMPEHVLIWAVSNGRFPENCIDHIDGNPANNRITNLREATHKQNMANRRSARGSSSIYLGVFWENGSGRHKGGWRAGVRSGKYQRRSGRFQCPAAAAKIYDKWALEAHGEFARLNFPAILGEKRPFPQSGAA